MIDFEFEEGVVEYDESDTVLYRDACGNERVIRVEKKKEDIKNGRPGLRGELVSATPSDAAPDVGSGVWAYDSQLIRVL